MPSTITPEPHQTALATQLIEICSACGALETQGPLAWQPTRWRTHCGDKPFTVTVAKARYARELMRFLLKCAARERGLIFAKVRFARDDRSLLKRTARDGKR